MRITSVRLTGVVAACIALFVSVTITASARAADIKRDKVPPAALATMDKVVPQGSKGIKYIEQKHDGKDVYVVEYDPPGSGSKKLKLHVNADGSVYGGAADNPGVDLSVLTPAAPAPAPAATAAPAPAPVQIPPLPPNPTEAQIRADMTARQARIDQINTTVAGLDFQIAVDAAKASDPNAVADKARLQAERDRQTAEATQQAVEISRDDQRIRDVEAKQNPQLAAAYAVPQNLDKEKLADTAGGGGQWKITNIQATDVPGPAYLQMLKWTKGTSGMAYSKMERGSETAYVVHYLNPANKRYFGTVWQDGKVRSEPLVSVYQPDAAQVGAITAAAKQTASTPAASAAEKHISGTQVPPAATKTMEQHMKGSKEETFYKDGDNYRVDYLNPKDNKHYTLTVAPDGKVVKGPDPVK